MLNSLKEETFGKDATKKTQFNKHKALSYKETRDTQRGLIEKILYSAKKALIFKIDVIGKFISILNILVYNFPKVWFAFTTCFELWPR